MVALVGVNDPDFVFWVEGSEDIDEEVGCFEFDEFEADGDVA